MTRPLEALGQGRALLTLVPLVRRFFYVALFLVHCALLLAQPRGLALEERTWGCWKGSFS